MIGLKHLTLQPLVLSNPHTLHDTVKNCNWFFSLVYRWVSTEVWLVIFSPLKESVSYILESDTGRPVYWQIFVLWVGYQLNINYFIYAYVHKVLAISIEIEKHKVTPVQDYIGPWGWQDVSDNRHMKVAKVSALNNGRLNPQARSPATYLQWKPEGLNKCKMSKSACEIEAWGIYVKTPYSYSRFLVFDSIFWTWNFGAAFSCLHGQVFSF